VKTGLHVPSGAVVFLMFEFDVVERLTMAADWLSLHPIPSPPSETEVDWLLLVPL
jgi:hypothetical protein